MFRRGLWVNLLNPKAIVFFLAFMPQFIRPEDPLLPQYLVLSATVMVIDILVMWFFFAAAAKTFQRFTHDARGQRILNRTFGVLFMASASCWPSSTDGHALAAPGRDWAGGPAQQRHVTAEIQV